MGFVGNGDDDDDDFGVGQGLQFGTEAGAGGGAGAERVEVVRGLFSSGLMFFLRFFRFGWL